VEPFKFWRCDKCGEPVGHADGYVIWGNYGQPDFEFRIVHQKVCDDKGFQSSMPLADFIGPDGLVKLTSMLSYGLHTKDAGRDVRSSHPLPDLDAWVDFVRRVQVPLYEQVRMLYLQPETRDDFSDAAESYPYLQKSITYLISGG